MDGNEMGFVTQNISLGNFATNFLHKSGHPEFPLCVAFGRLIPCPGGAPIMPYKEPFDYGTGPTDIPKRSWFGFVVKMFIYCPCVQCACYFI